MRTFNRSGATVECARASQNNDDYPDIVIGNRLYLGNEADDPSFAYNTGIQIGARDFAAVWVGDIDGTSPDDIVARYEDGAIEVFLTIHNGGEGTLAASDGVGFHSTGSQKNTHLHS